MLQHILMLLATVLLGSALVTPAAADESAPRPTPLPGQHAMKFVSQGNADQSMKYLLHLPADYGKDADKRWPVILFLHGSGERGDDVEKVKVHGPPKIVQNKPEFPFIVISPQCPAGTWWDVKMLSELLDDVMKSHQADPKRIYLTGLSMGGYGTWTMAAAYPDRFAAIVPICGGGKPEDAAKIAKIPTWVFHGDQDAGVPVARSIEMVEAMKKAGGEPKLTIYPGVGHDSWTATYDNPELYEWLLSKNSAAR